MENMYSGCIHSGIQYDHGAKWRPVENPCDVCHCLVSLIPNNYQFNPPSFLSPTSLMILFSPLTRKVMFAVRQSNVIPHVKTQLLLHPIPAVKFVKVGFFTLLLALCVFNKLQRHSIFHVCLIDCGVNGHDFPNGAVIPTEDRCQKCTCVVCLSFIIFLCINQFWFILFLSVSVFSLLQNGNVACSSRSCPAVSCRNPVHRAGDCCPR